LQLAVDPDVDTLVEERHQSLDLGALRDRERIRPHEVVMQPITTRTEKYDAMPL